MKKRTSASVTETPCTCGYLERHSAKPDDPIKLDPDSNQYYFAYTSSGFPGRLNIFHCPLCGGATPDSIPNPLFIEVPPEELERLRQLTLGLDSLEAAISRFGKPDEDNPAAVVLSTPSSKGEPPSSESCRRLIYRKLSEMAEIHFIDSRLKGVRIHFQAKRIVKK